MKHGVLLAFAVAYLGWIDAAWPAPRGQMPSRPTAVSTTPVACALSGDKDRVIADCTADIASGNLGPRPEDLYLARGNAYVAKGKTDLALADYTAALTLHPSSKLFNNRALMYEAKGDTRHAMADFDKALQLEPDNPAALQGRGDEFARQGQEEKALADFNHAIAVAPSFPFAYLARAHISLTRGDLKRARSDVAEYRRLMPGEPLGAKAEAAIQAAIGLQQPK